MSEPRRTRAGGAKKRPTRYDDRPTAEPLRSALNAHKKGAFAEATAGYLLALDREPDRLDAWLNLAAVLVQRGRARDAAAAFVRARALALGNARALRDVGIGLCSIGLFDAGIAALDAALALDPSLIGAWLQRARACSESGRARDAIDAATEAARRAPGDPSAWLELHRARFSLDDERCSEAARTAFELDPTNPHAALALAAISLANGAPHEGALDALSAPWQRLLRWCVARVSDEGSRALANKRDGLVLAAQSIDAAEALEFGVRFGTSTRALAEVCATVHGFDSFEGLPESFAAKPTGLFSMERTTPELPANVTLHVGWFEDTLPRFAEGLSRGAKLLHIDSDLYSSAIFVLDALAPALGAGSVIVFDELVGNEDWEQQEHRAIVEVSQRLRWSIEWLSVSWLTGQAVARLR
jgi:tetratricopeptide (TPR) repeat protein